MQTNELRRAIGLFSSRQRAEAALSRLRDAGFNMDKVSVIAKNTDTSDMAGARIDQDKEEQVLGATGVGAVSGAATGGLIGLIGSLGVLAIPGVGIAAEVGIVLANTLLGSGIGAASGGLVGALIGWGVPEDRANYYNTRVHEHGNYLILVEGTTQDIRHAESILGSHGIQDWSAFDAPLTRGDRRENPIGRY